MKQVLLDTLADWSVIIGIILTLVAFGFVWDHALPGNRTEPGCIENDGPGLIDGGC